MSVPTASSSSCRQRPPKFEKLEEAVNIWFAETRSRGAAVSDEMLQEKAKEFGTTMGILVNSSAMEVEDPMDELPLAALREALRQPGEKNPDEEASAFLDIDEETNSWEPMSDEQIMELVGESAQQGHQLVENFAPTETDDEEERPTVTRCDARRGLETAIAYLEQEGDGERALQVAEVLRFLDTKRNFRKVSDLDFELLKQLLPAEQAASVNGDDSICKNCLAMFKRDLQDFVKEQRRLSLSDAAVQEEQAMIEDVKEVISAANVSVTPLKLPSALKKDLRDEYVERKLTQATKDFSKKIGRRLSEVYHTTESPDLQNSCSSCSQWASNIRTPVYEKRGPKWCIASPGGPRRVQTYPGLGSTTRMPFSPDTGKPRTARRGRANPHGSGSVETPLSKHLLSQVPPAG
ncbi:major centromere autoantigen B-like [Ixodes scapularis]